MSIYTDIENKLESIGITINVPVNEFIDITSNIFHKYEANSYDTSQLALADSVYYWEKAFSVLDEKLSSSGSLDVLDFGCGTGFEAKLLLRSGLKDKCKTILCYDLSPEMLSVFRESVDPLPAAPEIVFLSRKTELSSILSEKKFDIILTNSILHHIPEPEEAVSFLLGSLRPGGYYISGHEPNRAFYYNRCTTAVTFIFRLFKRVYNRLSLTQRKKRKGLNGFVDTVKSTNEALLQNGIINKAIPTDLLLKLIDIHVPSGNSKRQCWGRIGFDKSLYKNSAGKDPVEITGYYTYSHIKDPLCNRFFFWRKLKQILACIFPGDGGDFLAVIKKGY